MIATLDTGDLSVVNLATGVRVPTSEFTFDKQGGAGIATKATWTHNGPLPDGNYSATLPAGSVADAAGNALAADHAISCFVLAGDANRDRSVDFLDLATLAQNYNTTGGKLWSKGDFNGDGSVDFSDMAILAQRYNSTLPAPAGAAQALTASSTSFAADLAAASATVAAPMTASPAEAKKAKQRPMFSITPIAKPIAAKSKAPQRRR